MKPLPLVFDAPKRGLPPRHLADLTTAERADAVAELGEKPFRARQLSNHYFSRLTVDPAEMTDIPAASRERLVGELMPTLLSEIRTLQCDDGTTRKTLWRAHDGTLLESVLMRYPGGDDHVLSGLMRGATEIRNRPAIIDQPSGKGRVILFAGNPCYRWQNFGEFNMLFNTLLNFNDIKTDAPKRPEPNTPAR